eukprot:3643773-Alexandrium_andersonii.AAC.1
MPPGEGANGTLLEESIPLGQPHPSTAPSAGWAADLLAPQEAVKEPPGSSAGASAGEIFQA